MEWFDWSREAPLSLEERDSLVDRTISNLKNRPYDPEGARFSYYCTGDTLIVGCQFKGSDPSVFDCQVRRISHPALAGVPSPQKRLTKMQEDAAETIKRRSESVNPEDIRPLSQRDDHRMRSSRAFGLAVWQEREAFVSFFAKHDPNFDADLFRKMCANE
jgi:hypothetical protein